MPADTNGWMEYKRLVLQQLEDLTTEVKSLRDEVTRLRVDVGQLKVQSAAWGAIAAMLVSSIVGFVFKSFP
jgi:hypothetical protein